MPDLSIKQDSRKILKTRRDGNKSRPSTHTINRSYLLRPNKQGADHEPKLNRPKSSNLNNYKKVSKTKTTENNEKKELMLKMLRNPQLQQFTKNEILVILSISEEVANTQIKNRMVDISERSGCSSKSLTGVIDSLEKKKIAARVRNPEDRRTILIELLEKGKQLIKTL